MEEMSLFSTETFTEQVHYLFIHPTINVWDGMLNTLLHETQLIYLTFFFFVIYRLACFSNNSNKNMPRHNILIYLISSA